MRRTAARIYSDLNPRDGGSGGAGAGIRLGVLARPHAGRTQVPRHWFAFNPSIGHIECAPVRRWSRLGWWIWLRGTGGLAWRPIG